MSLDSVPILGRDYQADLEIRGDGRTVVGIAVPYDAPTPIRDHQGTYQEVFRRGAFAKTIQERASKVKLLAQHNRQNLPIGRPSLLREDATGLYMEARISATRDGDEILELVRDGVLDSFSVGFRPVQDRWNAARDFVERTEARLDEVSVVAFPAYDGALISGVRHDLATPVGAGDETTPPGPVTTDDSAAPSTGRPLRAARPADVLRIRKELGL
jgi:HK97 family phage prohead protease